MRNKLIMKRRGQQGAALIIGMILLIAITILGLTNLSLVNLNEVISSNMHRKAIGFQASESAIQSAWDTRIILNSIPLTPLNNPPATSLARNTEYDQPKVDIDAEVTIQYCGESNVFPGYNLNADETAAKLVAQIFDLNGIASINNSNVNNHHVKRGFIARPTSNRKGNCPS